MAKIDVKPEIQEIQLKDIKPWSQNPRDISADALAGLQKSLEQFGYVDLIIVNRRTMEIVSGHQRVRILQQEGVESVPCIVVDMDELSQKALAVTLNNQQIAGYFTAALLPILEELRQQMPEGYLDLRLQQLREEVEQFEIDQTGATMPDDIPPAPAEAVTRPGDIWILGNHRLMCGDSTKPEDVAKLMDGQMAQLLATDPPYLIDYTGANRPTGGHDWSDLYREVDIKDGRAFMQGFLKNALRVIDESAPVYLWHADQRRSLINDIFKELDILIHQNIIWVKPCTILTYSVYPWRHEPCIFGWRRGKKPFFRPSRKKIGTVWEISLSRSGDPSSPEYYTDLWQLDWEGKKRNSGLEHPTVKPTEVFAIPMRVHTKPGDICYEPFSGSGSQIIAAEITGRRCFAMELEPVFVDVAVRRWEEFTGRKAELKK